MDCGPSCLKMVCKYHGKDVEIEFLRNHSYITKNGASFAGLSHAAERVGMNSLAVCLDYESLVHDVPVPCIAHWNQKHFVTVYEVNKKGVVVADPMLGLITYSHQEFREGWLFERPSHEGHLLLLETTPDFYEIDHVLRKTNFLGFLWPYVREHKRELLQLAIGLLFSSLLQLILPFLTQAVVDYGINYSDLDFVYLILIAQVVVFISMSSVELIRGWILLYLAKKVNIRLISDFLLKLMRLPVSFFDTKHSGDIVQRINDNRKIQEFLSSSSLTTLFSIVTIFVFSMALLHYAPIIFLVFFLGAMLYVGWSLLFFRKLAVLDNQRFIWDAENQHSVWQLITGMHEIKLNGSEQKRRWEWEGIQTKLFKISGKHLSVAQRQEFGALFINQFTNIIIVFLSAEFVIEGSLTLGALLSIQYIIGQINLPLKSIIGFLTGAQEAGLSIKRMTEIHALEREEPMEYFVQPMDYGGLNISGLTFRYGPPSTPAILKGLDLTIPYGKTTAIVGTSGSGKTTLLKLLLRFYDSYSGKILLENTELRNVSVPEWRRACGAVMQEGFIFEDSVLSNITESELEDKIDLERLSEAVRIANLKTFVENLPSGLQTKVGSSGVALSGGEKQRLLIARAVYKNPFFLFFDEATSALDTLNERIIMDNLREFYKGRTVIIIAHRLSTVQEADSIVVLEGGKIVEQGTHAVLTAQKGAYYELVRNQLNLGK